MNDAVFDEEFFKKLKEKIIKLMDFIKQNWFLGVIFLAILFAAIIIQQVILTLLSPAI